MRTDISHRHVHTHMEIYYAHPDCLICKSIRPSLYIVATIICHGEEGLCCLRGVEKTWRSISSLNGAFPQEWDKLTPNVWWRKKRKPSFIGLRGQPKGQLHRGRRHEGPQLPPGCKWHWKCLSDVLVSREHPYDGEFHTSQTKASLSSSSSPHSALTWRHTHAFGLYV